MKRFAALWLLMACLFSTAQAEDVEKRLSQAFEKYSALGASVAVIQNGEVTHTYAWGDARIGGDEVMPETLFQVGSIAKMVGNMGLMQLLTEQNISLDTELGEVLGYPIRHPEQPYTPVTLRQLMTHTAALRDSGDYQLALNGSPKPLSTIFGNRVAYAFHPGYTPGLQRHYTNFGGGLIGALIEKLSGQTLDQYMKENVFDPLDITAAYQYALLPESASVANMYHMPDRWIAKDLRKDTALVTQPDPETHYYFTAGKLIISAPDLAKLLIVLCDGGILGDTRILTETAAREIITPQNGRGSVLCDSGNGLFLNIITDDQVQGRTMYGHGGKAYGMLCAAYFDPADRTGVVMLTNGCNIQSVHNGVGMLGRVVMRICYDGWIDPAHEWEDPFSVGE